MTGASVADEGVRLLMLRHAQVPHHRGDVPITDLGVRQSEAAGAWFAREGIEVACLLSGDTLRSRSTAESFASAYRGEGGEIDDLVVSFALRNPDLYLGGHRINIGETSDFLASQSPLIEPSDVEALPFFHGLLTAKDRIGYWLEHGNPPGENAREVGIRISHFARSLAHVPALAGKTVVAVTHSPVLRAARYHHWAEYTREPPFLHGYELSLAADGGLRLATWESDTGDIPATSRPGPGVVRPE